MKTRNIYILILLAASSSNIFGQPAKDSSWYLLEEDFFQINGPHTMWIIDSNFTRDDEPIRAERNDLSRTGITHELYVIINLALYQYGSDAALYESISNFPDTMFVSEFKYYRMNEAIGAGILYNIPSFANYDYHLRDAIELDSTDTVDNIKPVTLRAVDSIVLTGGFTVPVGHELRFVAGRYQDH